MNIDHNPLHRLVLALVAGLLALSACQSQAPLPTLIPSSSPTSPQRSTPASASTSTPYPTMQPTVTSPLGVDPGSLRGLQVRFIYPGDDGLSGTFAELVRGFNASNPWGIWVEAEDAGSLGGVTDRVASPGEGQKPDVVLELTELTQSWRETPAQPVDLDAYIQDPVWGLPAGSLQAFYPAFTGGVGEGGVAPGLPAYRTGRVLFYNQTWARELGFAKPPETPGEFEQQACAAAESLMKDGSRANDGMGGWIIKTDGLTAESWAMSFGVNLGEDNPGGYALSGQEMLDTYTFLKNLVDKGCAWQARNPQPYDYFASRQALFFAGAPEDVIAQEQAMSSAGNKDSWLLLPFPGKAGEPVFVTEGPDYILLPGDPAHRLAGWLFIRWMIGVDNEARLVLSGAVLPVLATDTESLKQYRDEHPAWSTVLPLLKVAKSGRQGSRWLVVRPIFEDAFSQIFATNTTLDQLPSIVEMLDQTVREVLTR